MTVEIELTQGYRTTIDKADEDLMSFSWHAQVCGNAVYARRRYRSEGRYRTVAIHQVILERKIGRSLSRKEVCDHINDNTLDNRRDNLRVMTRQEMNRRKRKKQRKQYKGVRWYQKDKKWRSEITVDGVKHFLGNFDTPEEAAIQYNIEAKKLFGDFARLNKINTDEEPRLCQGCGPERG